MSATGTLASESPMNSESAARSAPRAWRLCVYAAIVLLVAVALRAWIVAQPNLGHDQDLDLFTKWIRGLTDHGLAGFYAREAFCDYPPLMLLAFQALGGIADTMVGGRASHDELRIAVKSLACAADIGIGVLLVLGGVRYLGARAGVAAASLYLLNPVGFYDSAYWGQVDSIYTGIMLAALLAALRQRSWLAGGLALVGVSAKFQAIVFVPLIVFEAYRVFGFRAVGRAIGGALVAAAIVATPFLIAGTLGETLDRSYVRVVGQYHELSKNAYNVWYLTGSPEIADTSPPAALVRAVAAGREQVHANEHWLLSLSWRRISLAGFALSVAMVLSLYSLRPGPIGLFAAAGALALCFFLFPTEMHERYAFPMIAMLAIWAASAVGRERVYWFASMLLLLNLAAVLPADVLAAQIAAANLVVFGVLLAAIAIGRVALPLADEAPAVLRAEDSQTAAVRPLIHVFRAATAIGVIGAVGGGAWAVEFCRSAAAVATPADTASLSTLSPKHAQQGWKSLGVRRSVGGGELRIGDTFYLDGIGTHAPARIVYAIPDGATSFEAIAGIDASTSGKGSVIIHIELDGKRVYSTGRLTGDASREPIRVAFGGARELVIVADPAGDGKRADHVNLALARFRFVPDATSVE